MSLNVIRREGWILNHITICTLYSPSSPSKTCLLFSLLGPVELCFTQGRKGGNYVANCPAFISNQSKFDFKTIMKLKLKRSITLYRALKTRSCSRLDLAIVMCHVSRVTCHMSRVTCHIFLFIFFCLPFPPQKKYRSYDPHRSRDSVFPVCGIF